MDQITSRIYDWLVLNVPKLLVTIIVLLILHILIRTLIQRVEKQLINRAERKGETAGEAKKRVTTLTTVIEKTAYVALWVFGFIMILDQIGLDIAPLLAAAGIIGLAIGFGAQNLARDFISGAFLLIENQIRVGDVAIINGTGGLVEDVNLRTVILRDFSGVVHVFPNGTITQTSNMTKDWSAFVLDMGVAYKEDPDRVMEIMKQVGLDMMKEDEWKGKILAEPEVVGLDNFGDSAIVIKMRIKTQPIQQWGVGREYRKRLKRVLDDADIEIPFPHMSLYFGEATKPFELMIKEKGAS